MNRRSALKGLGAAAMVPLMFGAEAGAADADTVYELRTYHLNEGKEPLILERFRTKETAIFERLGMHGVGYWTASEEAVAGPTLVYMLRHRSREAAKESWAKFAKDPEWLVVKAETEKDGAFVKLHESVFLKLTDFSPKV